MSRMSSPLLTESLDSALADLGTATVLPAAAYTSVEVFSWEQRNLFAASWVCIGRPEELRAHNEIRQRGLFVGDVPVLLTWSDDEVVPRAFANTCRHRGHELVRCGEDSSRSAIVCPYHAWSYKLDGSLMAAPGFRGAPMFDPTLFTLVELPVVPWHGWVFVNATADAESFTQHVGAMEDLVSPYAPENLVLRASHTYVLAANWKVIAENYHECYHCPLIHPELCEVSPPTSGDNYHDLEGNWVGGSMELREHAETMSLGGRSGGVPLPGVDPRKVEYLHLLPNLLVSAHPDYLMTHRLEPLAPDKTRITCSWYFASTDVDPSYAVDFWDLTNKQDWAACESVQRGLSSPHFRPGPLAPNEDAVHDFVRRIATAYADPNRS
jgi:Rieske 2Fe-2S family protein